jgi:hypothetical protein
LGCGLEKVHKLRNNPIFISQNLFLDIFRVADIHDKPVSFNKGTSMERSYACTNCMMTFAGITAASTRAMAVPVALTRLMRP